MNIRTITLLLVAMFAFASCGDDDNDEEKALEAWKSANEAAFNAIKTNSEYKELKSPGNEGSIYYKVLKEGTGTKQIYYTSTVNCYYKGWYAADYPDRNIKKGDVFDQKLYDDGAPYSIKISNAYGINYPLNINGIKTALQYMHEGDKWEIWVPYQLGYGDAGRDAIPGYSTLAIELELFKVITY